MESIALIKRALSATKKTIDYANTKRGKKTKKRGKRKKSFGKQLTVFAGLLFAGVCVIAIALSTLHVATTQKTQSTSLPSNSTKVVDEFGNVVNMANKEMTLKASASAQLTLYGSKSADTLSSSVVDESTGNQSYMRYMGKGGVTTAAAAGPSTQCIGPKTLAAKLMKYLPGVHIPSGGDAICNSNKDFLTSTDTGALFVFPADLTSQNAAVTAIVNGVRIAAWLVFTPMIMLIGFSVMRRSGSVTYAGALENLQRLILALIGVTLCDFIAGQFLGYASTICQGLWALFSSQFPLNGVTLDINTIVMPSSMWSAWMTYLLVLGMGLLIAQVVSTATILFQNIGAAIGTAVLVIVSIAIIQDMPHLVILSLSTALGAEIIIRIILVDLFIILSPFAMVAIGLPGQVGVNFARSWITGFFSLLMSQIAQVSVLGIGMVVLGAYTAHGSPTDIVGDFITYGTLALALRVPSLFPSNAASLVQQVGPMVAAGVQHERTIFY